MVGYSLPADHDDRGQPGGSHRPCQNVCSPTGKKPERSHRNGGQGCRSQQDSPTTAYGVTASPNPFNPRTTLFYSLPVPGRAELVVYDLAGRRVKTLVSGHVEAGQHAAEWDGRDEQGRRVASGVYLYNFVSGEFKETKRIVLLK